MTAAAATTASARAGAAGGARGAGDIHSLARGLAKNEKDPDKLTDAMTGLGYSKSEARDAANKATGTNPAPKAPSAPKASTGSDTQPRQGKPVGFDDAPAAPAFRFPSGGGSGAGVLLAVVLYPAGLAFLRGGPAGFKAWLAAKFLNRTGTTGTKA